MEILLPILAAAIGIYVGYIWRKQTAQAKANSIEALAEKRLIEVKNKEQNIQK